MTIPILIDGKRRGALELCAEGAYMRFEARCALRPGVQRLYVFGGGRSACLGVLAPENGALTLRRRLSRAAMKDFPAPIEYAALEAAANEEATAAAPLRKSTREEARPAAAPHIKWEPQPDGSLVGTEDGRRLLALPCALRRVPPGVKLREIGGRRYLVFRS